jgi:NAD(P)-dependent dehydrogenase (short-subunit alcohol dehydrogenase family)
METILQGDLYGKTYLITGATSGIGLAAAEALARRGAVVLGVGRSPERCAAAERRLRATPGCIGAVYFTADLSLQSQVRGLAEQVRAWLAEYEVGALDGLLNNAGTFTFWYTLTAEGFETQWAVNHLASFLLTTELLPWVAGGRVVTVSSASHYGARIHWDDPQLRRRYNGLTAYGQSKLANVLFTAALDGRLRASGGRAFAADPGLVRTDIGLKGTPALVRWAWQRRRAGGISPEESARGIVHLLTGAEIASSPHIYWKHAQPQAPSRQAQEIESARRLWQLSERMVGANPAAAPIMEARYAPAD